MNLSAEGRSRLVEQLEWLEREYELYARCARMDIGEDDNAERDLADAEETLKLWRALLGAVKKETGCQR